MGNDEDKHVPYTGGESARREGERELRRWRRGCKWWGARGERGRGNEKGGGSEWERRERRTGRGAEGDRHGGAEAEAP